uniref:Uncharacterized protein n=1 Tax=Rhizophora mucronata TaxID=61149 RepID=A0A2P2Q226_RHIMU
MEKDGKWGIMLTFYFKLLPSNQCMVQITSSL